MADVEAKVAAHGQKMIEVTIKFWTNGLAGEEGMISPKNAWDGGVVAVSSNKAHGIPPMDPLPFNGLAELPAKIERAILQQGVTLHLSRRASRYLRSDVY